MIIYKITNQINGKIYIGQTINTLEKRFNRHKQDALSGRLDTHFARALREYGVDNFVAEVIENVNSQEELNIREHYWINYYNSCKEGYNETDSILKSVGSTYQSKTADEMEIIKAKITNNIGWQPLIDVSGSYFVHFIPTGRRVVVKVPEEIANKLS